MYAMPITHLSKRTADSKTSTANLLVRVNRLRRESGLRVFEMPLPSDEVPTPSNYDSCLLDRRPFRDDTSLVNVTTVPSSQESCRHQLIIEDGTRLKTLDLPSTSCVAVSQRFEARTGDTLTYDYVVLLQSKGRSVVDRPTARAEVVNLTSESSVSLMNRSPDGSTKSGQKRIASRFRETQLFTILASGQYELRFTTFVDFDQHLSEAHLLVDSVRVVNSDGQEMSRLASLSCVGRASAEIRPVW